MSVSCISNTSSVDADWETEDVPVDKRNTVLNNDGGRREGEGGGGRGEGGGGRGKEGGRGEGGGKRVGVRGREEREMRDKGTLCETQWPCPLP